MTDHPDQRPHDPLRGLNPRQHTALEVLLAGGTQQQAADIAGVTRQTVNGWQNRHPGFAAEYRQHLRLANQQLITDRLRGCDIVMQHLLDGVNAGEGWAITAWLKHVGMTPLSADVIGPTDPEQILAATFEHRLEQRRLDEHDDHLASSLPFHIHRRDVRHETEEELIEYFADLEATVPVEAAETDEPDNP